MYHGGVNPTGNIPPCRSRKLTGYANDLPVKSYDFQTCLRENGLPSESYYRLRKHHVFIKNTEELLAPAKGISAGKYIRGLRVQRIWRHCGQPSVIIKRRTAGSYLSIITRENGK